MKSTPSWLTLGLGLFVIVLMLWLLLPLLSTRSAEAQMVLPSGLLSQLNPNYAPDSLSGVVGTLRLTILRDLAPGSPDDMEEELLRPVPTATWRDFDGAAPYTATPTTTPTPTPTKTPTPTNTPTRTPTRTPRPTITPTDEPEEPPPPPPPPPPTHTPTITPTPTPPDASEPEVKAADPDPAPGYLGDDVCTPTIEVVNIHIVDDPPSYGMNFVKLKYQVIGFSGLIFSNDLSPPVSGGPKGGGWDAIYEGNIEFQIDTDKWDSKDDFVIELYVKAEDKGGNTDNHFIGEYTIDEACDEI